MWLMLYERQRWAKLCHKIVIFTMFASNNALYTVLHCTVCMWVCVTCLRHEQPVVTWTKQDTISHAHVCQATLLIRSTVIHYLDSTIESHSICKLDFLNYWVIVIQPGQQSHVACNYFTDKIIINYLWCGHKLHPHPSPCTPSVTHVDI